MTRAATAFDRSAVLLVGLVLVASGLAAAGWQLGRLPVASQPSQQFSTGQLAQWPDQAWWPVTLAVTGVILVLLALRWLLAHRPARRLPAVTLDGTDESGRLRADLSAVAQAAATALAGDLSIRSARGRALDDRGRRTIELTATIAAESRLPAVEQATTAIARQVHELAGPDVAVRIRCHSARPA
jgi:hypothetical protein